MGFGRGKNRRRADAAERARTLRSAFSRAVRVLVRAALAVGLLAGAAFGAREGYRWATTSERFALSRLTFDGTHRADEAELARLAGLSRGVNLFLLDVAAATRGIEQHPWVRTAEVTRHFPSSVSVRVVEHEPAAMIALGDLYLLDGYGEPFKRITPDDALDLPLVTGISRDAYVADPVATAESMRRALAALEEYSAAEKVERPSELRIEPFGLTVVTASGTQVRFGDGATPDKLARLGRVRAELSRRGLTASVIHLDNRVRPGWVAVKLSTPSSERGNGSSP